MAFSEHGNVMGWKHKKDIIENTGMKYIHACEFYLTEDDIKEDKQIKYLQIEFYVLYCGCDINLNI